MDFMGWIKGVIRGIFKKEALEEFKVDVATSSEMENAISLWKMVYLKRPPWVDIEDNIKTIGFGKTIATETARLATLELEITLDGSARAEYLQKEINKCKNKIRQYLEYACAFGEVILKPNGTGIDCVEAGNFIPTDYNDNGTITGAIFFDTLQKGDNYYTRMEYHRFVKLESVDEKGLQTVNSIYVISNRAYRSKNESEIGKQVSLDSVQEWANLKDENYIQNLEKPLFACLKMPNANGVDTGSPLGVSVYSDAIEELKDLDIAYSRYVQEIADSEKIVFLDDRLLNEPGTNLNERRTKIKLPKFVRQLFGGTQDEAYHEVNPSMQTEQRIAGINQLLSMIGYKCGYSNGYYRFDQGRGLVTATQIEAEDKRTIETISDIRTSLKTCIEDLIYALDKYADLYNLAPYGQYEVSYYMKDITVSFSEDRQRYYNLAMANKFPWKKYYMEYEGYSEEEAEELIQMLQDESKSNGDGLYSGLTAE